MGGLFKPKLPDMPEPTKPLAPAPMPDSESPAVMEARRKAAMDAMNRGGRSSTILSDAGSRGDSYSKPTLG